MCHSKNGNTLHFAKALLHDSYQYCMHHGKQYVWACYVKHINMKWCIIQKLKQKHLDPQLLSMGVHWKAERL